MYILNDLKTIYLALSQVLSIFRDLSQYFKLVSRDYLKAY